jgi:TrmH RNA methyltransferase
MPCPVHSPPRNKRTAQHVRPPHERELQRICGLAAIHALFDCDPDRVERLFFEPALRGDLEAFCLALARAHKPYREVDRAELARVAGTVLHGGAVAIARPRPLVDLDSTAVRTWVQDGKPLLILDGIGNPHNLGAIARTAAFFGLTRIVLADRPDQALPSDAAYRVAEGGLEYVALYRASLPAALRTLRHAYRIVGTSLDKGVPYVERAGASQRSAAPPVGMALGDRAPEDGASPMRQARPVALILGNEETGLDRAMLDACDEVVKIPGTGHVQSLNVANAAAILIYLLTRSPSG